MKKISRERADEILEQLDLICSELFDADMISQGNTVLGLCDELEDAFEAAANNVNPFNK